MQNSTQIQYDGNIINDDDNIINDDDIAIANDHNDEQFYYEQRNDDNIDNFTVDGADDLSDGENENLLNNNIEPQRAPPPPPQRPPIGRHPQRPHTTQKPHVNITPRIGMDVNNLERLRGNMNMRALNMGASSPSEQTNRRNTLDALVTNVSNSLTAQPPPDPYIQAMMMMLMTNMTNMTNVNNVNNVNNRNQVTNYDAEEEDYQQWRVLRERRREREGDEEYQQYLIQRRRRTENEDYEQDPPNRPMRTPAIAQLQQRE